MNEHIDLELGEAEYLRFNGAWIEAIVEQVRTLIPAGGTVLDLGCGRGELVNRLKRAGYDCVGVDADPRCVERAGAWCPTYTSSIESAPDVLVGRRFDLVVLSHVLEHTTDPGAALQAAAGLADRLVIVAVPNLTSIRSLADALRRRSGTVNRGHRQGWDRAHLEALMTNVGGLKVERFVPDRVEVPTHLGVLFARWGWADAVERRWLARVVPGLALSLIAVASVPTSSR